MELVFNVLSAGSKAMTRVIFTSMSKVSIFLEPLCTIVNSAVKYATPETFSVCTWEKCIMAEKCEMGKAKNLCDYEWVLPLSGETYFDNYVVPSENGVGFQCTMCGKEAVKKSNLQKHVENIHFPGSYSYSCKYCSQICTTKNQLNQHISRFHRGINQ